MCKEHIFEHVHENEIRNTAYSKRNVNLNINYIVYITAAGFCEHGDEPSGSIKGGEFGV
jgi:hypothetical protein